MFNYRISFVKRTLHSQHHMGQYKGWKAFNKRTYCLTKKIIKIGNEIDVKNSACFVFFCTLIKERALEILPKISPRRKNYNSKRKH